MLLTPILMLAAGLVLLVFAGDYLVRGAVGLAENLGIPPLIIGLTIVALGTSLPELFVSVQAALDGSPGIATGNVVGSNIANVLLVLGLPALIAMVLTDEEGAIRSIIFMLVLSVATAGLMLDGNISRLEGGILALVLAAFLTVQVIKARNHKTEDGELEALEAEVGAPPHDGLRIAAYIIGGVIALPIAANLTVSGASDIARVFGVSDAAIGLSIVAIGTSLPELAAGVMAAIRKNSQVAIGNVVGSNIFNIAGILGATALIVPLPVAPEMVSRDLPMMIGAAVLLLLFAWTKRPVTRIPGLAMLAAYAFYIVSVF